MQERDRIESLLKKYISEARVRRAKEAPKYGSILRYLNSERDHLMALLAYLCFEEDNRERDGELLSNFTEYYYFSDILSDEEIEELGRNKELVEQVAFSSRWMLDQAYEYVTPNEIIQLMLEVAGIPEGSNIYNPFAGLNTIAILGKQYHVCGEELNHETWMLGQLRLWLTGNDAHIVQSNSFTAPSVRDIDNVVCCPPFAQKGFVDLVHDWYDHLKVGGKIVFLIEPSMLFNFANKSFWKEMVANKSIQFVAQLPESILVHTEVAPCIVVLEKKEQDSMLFADFSFAHKSYSAKSKLQVLDIESIRHTLEMAVMSDDPHSEILRKVPYAAYKESLGVYPLNYLIDRAEGTPLLDTVAIIRDYERIMPEKAFRVVMPADLSATYPLAPITPHTIERENPSTRYVRIPNNAVLIATNSRGLLIGYTEELGEEPVYAPHTILVLRPKELSVAHLMLLLMQPSVAKQFTYANKFTRGVIHRITNDTLSNIILPVIPEESVEELVDKAKVASLSEGERKLLDKYNQFEHSVRLRKHAAVQNMSSIDSVLNSLKRCLERNNWNVSGSMRLNAVSEFTVQSAVEFLVKQMQTVSQQIKNLTDPEYKSVKPDSIDLQNFTDEYFAENIPLNFKFLNEIDNHYKERLELRIPSETGGVDQLAYIEEGSPIDEIHFPKDALRQIYQNIVSNAVEYGFTDPKRDDYCMIFSMHKDGSSIILEISNNGNPLGADVTPSDVLEEGFSTKLNEDGHGGHGGGEIAALMKANKGFAEVLSSPDEEYTVTYRLTFQDTNTLDLGNLW